VPGSISLNVQSGRSWRRHSASPPEPGEETMIIRKLKEVRASDRNVKSDGWDSARLLLAEDGMGFSFHLTTLRAGSELKMHYKNHLEAVMVLKGTGTIEDLGTGETHELKPGILYALNENDRHIVRP